jgi:chromosome segregation ATPase
MWLAAACPLVWGQGTFSGPVPEIYTCVDAKGRQLSSDRWIADCADREQKVLNPSGTVKTVVLPALTALERQELDAKKKTLQLERASQEDDKKRDRALLARYPSLASHQKERTAALADLFRTRQATVAQILTLQAERFQLAEEMAFYEKDPSKAPPRLRTRLAELDNSLAAQKRLASGHDASIDRINARFDTEALRLKPLWPLASP